MSDISEILLEPTWRTCNLGRGRKLERDLRPFSSMYSSLRFFRGEKAPYSTWRILFLSSTSSRTCVRFSRPSIREMSLPCTKRTLRLERGRRRSEAREWISLKPSCRTSREEKAMTGTTGASEPLRCFSGSRFSIRLWLRRRTERELRSAMPVRSVMRLLSRLRIRRLGKKAPVMQSAVSRILQEARSSSLTWPKLLCPNLSTRNSSDSLPLYVSFALDCSPLSTPRPSRTLSFLRWKMV
mmetsp:Transcript_14381/g.49120  ORF Transcript_14381/g.49120 Transcript_14381/m.49120 type:complete len:240 (-) Transcript_14381:2379-3098(-)